MCVWVVNGVVHHCTKAGYTRLETKQDLRFLSDHSGGISVSRVFIYLFYIYIFCSVSSLITVVLIFCFLVIFLLVKLVFVKTDKVMRCLKYIAILISAQSVRRRNNDNNFNLSHERDLI